MDDQKCIIVSVHPTTCHLMVWTRYGMRTPGSSAVVAEVMLSPAAHFQRRRLEEQELENMRLTRIPSIPKYSVIPITNGD